jgi:hypothetical protein
MHATYCVLLIFLGVSLVRSAQQHKELLRCRTLVIACGKGDGIMLWSAH